MKKDKIEKIVFCVTNDLVHDQRMDRICSTLADWGNQVVLIGRESHYSKPLKSKNYQQKRLKSRFLSGKMMYLEYNLRLFFYLLTVRTNTLVAIDLDTIAPVYCTSVFKKTKRIYDAHELFTEMKEVITRPLIQKIWLKLEQFMVPRFPLGMTVSQSIADEFNRRYQVNYSVIMNTPYLENHSKENQLREKNIILYQGAVNEGRCLEWLVPAMKKVNGTLWICGDGNFMNQCQNLIHDHQLEKKIILMGMLLPKDLKSITQKATIGINLIEPVGLNQIYSLANKFFDYIHSGLPQITMNFPEYRKINSEFEVAVLIDEPDIEIIAQKLNNLLENRVLYERLVFNCHKASLELNWQKESQKLIQFFPKQ